MDSKKKFNKNRYWKKKYQPRHGNTSVKPTPELKNKDHDQSEEDSENENALKQPIPNEGWFPEYDSSSSSDLEDFYSLTCNPSLIPSSSSKNYDKNWFDKELDNIQLTSETPTIDNTKNNKQNQNKVSSAFQKTLDKKYQASNFKLQSTIVKNSKDEKNDTSIKENDEEELDFLLSLKEPIHTGPIIVKKNIEDERKFSNNVHLEQKKTVKSIDLEKWLDSVLDN